MNVTQGPCNHKFLNGSVVKFFHFLPLKLLYCSSYKDIGTLQLIHLLLQIDTGYLSALSLTIDFGLVTISRPNLQGCCEEGK